MTLEPLLTEKMLAAYLSVSKALIRRWRQHGGGPPFTKLGEKSVRYRLRDVQKWLDGRVRT